MASSSIGARRGEMSAAGVCILVGTQELNTLGPPPLRLPQTSSIWGRALYVPDSYYRGENQNSPRLPDWGTRTSSTILISGTGEGAVGKPSTEREPSAVAKAVVESLRVETRES
jgi:hypothetical protein